MKIRVNPFAVTAAPRRETVANEFRAVSQLFARIRAALARQEEHLAAIETALQKRSSTRKIIDAILDEMDRTAVRCAHNGSPILDGRYAKWNPRASMWLYVTPRIHSRKRIFIATMTSKGLNLRGGSEGQPTRVEELAGARAKIAKCRADIQAYENRLSLATGALANQPAAAFEKLSLEYDVRTRQSELVRTAMSGLAEDLKILERMRELARLAVAKKPEMRLHLQVEVSQLIDEVDRVASQTEYNRMKLLTGTFAGPEARGWTASLWFVTGGDEKRRERVYINTIHARSLGLRDKQWRNAIDLTAPSGNAAAIIDAAVLKATKERDYLAGKARELEAAGELKRTIVIENY